MTDKKTPTNKRIILEDSSINAGVLPKTKMVIKPPKVKPPKPENN